MERSRLLPSLILELVQAERSQYRCSIRQAERLGGVPPSIAVRAVAAHANEALDELPKLARARGVRLTTIAQLGTDAFSFLRETVVDRFVDNERTYRGVLLGMRLGIDLVRVLRVAADDEGDAELVAWCARWQATRERLVAGVERELDWFGRRPRFSLAIATAS